MTPHTTLAKILLQKGIVRSVQQANLISVGALVLVIAICLILIGRTLFVSEPIDPRYYYDPNNSAPDIVD